MQDLTPIIVSILSLIVAIVSIFLIPYLKKKYDNEKRMEIYTWTKMAVYAAEQLCKTGVINRDQRKQEVINFLNEHGYTVDMDVIETMIESIVLELPETLIAPEDETDPSLPLMDTNGIREDNLITEAVDVDNNLNNVNTVG